MKKNGFHQPNKFGSERVKRRINGKQTDYLSGKFIQQKYVCSLNSKTEANKGMTYDSEPSSLLTMDNLFVLKRLKFDKKIR